MKQVKREMRGEAASSCFSSGSDKSRNRDRVYADLYFWRLHACTIQPVIHKKNLSSNYRGQA